MADIYLGIVIVLALASFAGWLAYRVARWGGRWIGVPVAVLAVAALWLNVAYFRHSIWPARVLPFSNMMILAEPSPLLAGILVGVGAVILPGGRVRRASWLVPLSAVCLFASYGELLGTPPRLGESWKNDVCRQTSPASCGPAAAATLLAANGIPAKEKEMARLCLTTGDGTSPRAIYRGLLLKTRGTDLRVEPFRGDIDALCKLNGPTLLSVRLDPGPKVDPRYQEVWGWKPGVSHSVVLFGRSADGRFIIGDPATGLEKWDLKAIQTLWHGEGLRLVPRDPQPPQRSD
jgi:hypothetical protein